MKLRYTPRARSDLAELYDYIAQENPGAARRVILLIRKAAESLLENPQIGRPGRVDGTRELTIARFPFLAVIHTARLWPENFQG
jgi:toxin ParE1/3/4